MYIKANDSKNNKKQAIYFSASQLDSWEVHVYNI